MKRFCVALLAAAFLVTAAAAKCTVREVSAPDGPRVRLENDFVRLTFAPTSGGSCVEFIYKPTSKNLTSRDPGCLVDRIWNYTDKQVYNGWQALPYATDTTQGDHDASVTLRARGKSGIAARMEFEKRITVTEGCSAVRADYRLHVGQEAMVPLRVGLWWHNRLGVAGEDNTYYLPKESGVLSLPYGPGAKGELWHYDPVRGWNAFVSSSGTGLACEMEYPRLMCFYEFLHGELPTIEWATRSFEVPNGGSLDTTIWLIPFSGLSSVCGAGGQVVVGLDLPDQLQPAAAQAGVQTHLQLAAGTPRKAEVTLRVRRLPDGPPQRLLQKAVQLRPGPPLSEPVRFAAARPGSYVFSGEVRQGEKLLTDFERLVVVGRPSGEYRLAANEQRLGKEGERFEDKIAAKGSGPRDIKLSMEVETPHVSWARPYVNGPIRALVLNSLLTGRESVELAQRLDLDLTAPTFGRPNEIRAGTQILGGQYNLQIANENLRQLLKNETFDVAVIGGLSSDLLEQDVLDALFAKVKAGMGLVWIQPTGKYAPMWEVLPFKSFKPSGIRPAAWKREQDHYLTRGLPWDVMPEVGFSRYKAGGEVLATTKGLPLLAVSDPEAGGRTVALAYNTSWQGPNSYMNGLTPWLRFPPQRFDYWEYHFSLLAHCLVWAARKESNVQITRLAPDKPAYARGRTANAALVLQVQNGAAAGPAQAWLRLQDACGHVSLEEDRPLDLPAGAGELRLALPENLIGGLHLADVVLKRGGKTLDWASTALHVTPEVEIAQLEVPDDVFASGRTLEATATLAGTAPPGAKVRGELIDRLGRLMARVELPAGRTVHLALPVQDPLTTLATVRCTVVAGDQVIARAEADALLLPDSFRRRQWDETEQILWGTPGGAYAREYLIQPFAGVLKDIGITACLTFTQWLHREEQEGTFRAGFKLMPYGFAPYELRLSRVEKGKLTFQQQRDEYVKTKDKKYLERPYCLNSDFSELTKTRTANSTATCARFAPIGYCVGDELGTTYYTTPYDYDFSPEALAAFRQWLKRQYGDLAKLNAEWETTFASWQQVMPLTALEVKGRRNYAPWADHRSFMEWSYADFFRRLKAELRKGDPEARIGISGTQAAEAYGGYDWWRLAHALDFLQAYTHQTTGEMQRSFGIKLRAPWYGYAGVNPGLSYAQWHRLLNSARGGSYFVISYIVRPDWTLTQSTADCKQWVQEARSGAAKLLLNADSRPADIAVHYSHPSIHGAYITGADDLFRNNRNGWVQCLNDLGYQIDYYAYAQIEAGILARRKPRVLVLPYSIALSAQEAQAIEQYVRQGGFLIADGRTGLMDEHCRTLPQGRLDKLLGLERDNVEPAPRRQEGEAVFGDLKFMTYAVEPTIKLSGGKTLGTLEQVPLCQVRQVGRGTVVFLNMFLGDYQRRRKLEVEAPVQQLVARVLEQGGVTPPYPFQVEGGKYVYLAPYRTGKSTYLGVLRAPEENDATVTLHLPGKPHVYALLSGRYLGHSSEARLRLGPGRAEVLCLLPYRATGLRVTAPKQAQRGGEVKYGAKLLVAGGKPDLHVFRVAVSAPDGQAMDHYGATLLAPGGQAQGSFRLALNDAPGKWTITVTDALTRAHSRATVTCR